MSSINFVLSWVEYEKSNVTSGPGVLQVPYVLKLNVDDLSERTYVVYVR